MTQIDLTRYGTGMFNCRGTLQTRRLDGQRLLLLLGERHSLKPFVRNNLLNVIELDKLGVLSCVGVEGHPGKDIPGEEVEHAFRELQKQHAGNDEKLVTEMLRGTPLQVFHFWKTLVLMRPGLKVQSVDDAGLCDDAEAAGLAWWDWRRRSIRASLEQSDLLEVGAVAFNQAGREQLIRDKVALQAEQEWAEHEANVARDGKMLENLMALWEQSGPEKVAVLNAGSSHQWRIARRLPPDISYYHIEQP